jgi:hypothetical protein
VVRNTELAKRLLGKGGQPEGEPLRCGQLELSNGAARVGMVATPDDTLLEAARRQRYGAANPLMAPEAAKDA